MTNDQMHWCLSFRRLLVFLPSFSLFFSLFLSCKVQACCGVIGQEKSLARLQSYLLIFLCFLFQCGVRRLECGDYAQFLSCTWSLSRSRKMWGAGNLCPSRCGCYCYGERNAATPVARQHKLSLSLFLSTVPL
ncbi:unnamed protein product, partial [Discosporangium mesarthrocarpum]